MNRLGTDPSRPLRTTTWGLADDGSVIEIQFEVAAEAQLAERWPPIGLVRQQEQPGTARRRLTVRSVSTQKSPIVQIDGAGSPGGWERLESELAIFAAERLNGLVAVHAALIEGPSGTILLPGPSGVGKSTLCIAASRAGAAVLSDEYALIDPSTALVTGWRRPVRLRRPDGSVDRFDLAVAHTPVVVNMIATLVHESWGQNRWSVTTAADVVMSLMANTVCASSRPDEALDAALAVALSAPAIAGTRGDAGQAIDELLAAQAQLVRT